MVPEGWKRERFNLSSFRDTPSGVDRAQWENALSIVDDSPWHFDLARQVGRVHSVTFEAGEAYALFDFPKDCVVGASAVVFGIDGQKVPTVHAVVVHAGDAKTLAGRIEMGLAGL